MILMKPPALRRSSVNGVAASCAVHGALIAAALYLTSAADVTRTAPSHATPDLPSQIVWLNGAAGPGGAEGGGGNDDKAPPRAVEVKGADGLTMPSAARSLSDSVEELQPPAPLPDAPVQTLGASSLTAMGLMEAGSDTLSQGSGDDGGAGTGRGKGIGPGDGNRIGDGRGTGIGDVYGVGNGVTMPVALHQEKPQYTLEAMRARIEGAVVVECVVEPTGLCAKLRVLRSLDSRLGLDQQALRAAAAWRFSPGTRLGKPVAVLVTIQLGFSIH